MRVIKLENTWKVTLCLALTFIRFVGCKKKHNSANAALSFNSWRDKTLHGWINSSTGVDAVRKNDRSWLWFEIWRIRNNFTYYILYVWHQGYNNDQKNTNASMQTYITWRMPESLQVNLPRSMTQWQDEMIWAVGGSAACGLSCVMVWHMKVVDCILKNTCFAFVMSFVQTLQGPQRKGAESKRHWNGVRGRTNTWSGVFFCALILWTQNDYPAITDRGFVLFCFVVITG